MDYTVYTKFGDWDFEKKKYVPALEGETKVIYRSGEYVDIYDENNASFIYIDIDAYRVRNLLLTTVTLADHTSIEKHAEKAKLIEHIEYFKRQC